MSIYFASRFTNTPLEDLLNHSEKVKECVWAFQQAMNCFTEEKFEAFEDYISEVKRIENQANTIMLQIRGPIFGRSKLPMSEVQLILYLQEQNSVLNSVKDCLTWLSLRKSPGFPNELKKDLLSLVDTIIEPIEDLNRMVTGIINYFETYSEMKRYIVMDIINHLKKRVNEAHQLENYLKKSVFAMEDNSAGMVHMLWFLELVGFVTTHVENAVDIMSAVIMRKNRRFF